MKMKFFAIRLLTSFLILTTMLISSGCVELTAIRNFAESSKVVSQKFPSLSADFYRSCVQTYKYYYYDRVTYNPQKMQAVDEISGKKDINAEVSAVFTDGNGNTPEKDEVACREWKSVVPLATNLNKTLVDYMKALGDLAADDIAAYDKDYDALQASIVATKVFKPTEVAAGTKLAKFLTDVLAKGYRRKKLKTAIEQQNANVAILTDALALYISDNYASQLMSERNDLDKYYETLIKASLLRDAAISNQLDKDKVTHDYLSAVTLKQTWDTEAATLQERIDAADAYGKIMAKVKEGHQKLYDNRNNLNSPEVKKMALSYANTIEDLVETFGKAF